MPDKENQILKAAKGLLPYFATPAMLVYIIWEAATFKAEIKPVTFTDAEKKFKTEQHITNGPTAAEEAVALKMDSINKVDAIRSRKERDSLLRIMLKKQERQDSINLLNADQMFQIKEVIKNIH